jgi:two-component system chemotaxis response regulator CheY
VPEVLVVDDSKVMREMIAACLRPDPSLTITQAASGLEAIERLSLKTFDIVVLDLNMPDIGGLEVVEVLAAGASRYMTKPFAPPAILGEVQSLLSEGAGSPGPG